LLARCRAVEAAGGRLLGADSTIVALAGETDLRYLGGALPMPAPLAKRAMRLATDAVRTLDAPLGYLGVDLVLGDDSTGAGDVVIEINPRLTTSYVGLRALAKTNLAAALVDVARGDPVELCWKERSIQFDATGTLREDSTH
jgi:predicted ATP-grasp superfamily ATP-dependent carboligase